MQRISRNHAGHDGFQEPVPDTDGFQETVPDTDGYQESVPVTDGFQETGPDTDGFQEIEVSDSKCCAARIVCHFSGETGTLSVAAHLLALRRLDRPAKFWRGSRRAALEHEASGFVRLPGVNLRLLAVALLAVLPAVLLPDRGF